MQFPELDYGIHPEYIQTPKSLHTIACCQSGSGPIVLLFIHGLASNMRGWFKLIPFLSPSFRCIAVDLPGYGKSSATMNSGEPSLYASVIRELIETLELENVVPVGHSMGGQICISAALKYPQLFKNMILLAPAGLEVFTEDEIAWVNRNFTTESFMRQGEFQIRAAFNTNFYNAPGDLELMIEDRMIMTGSPGFRDYCSVVVNSLGGLLREPVIESLHQLNTRTLVVFGENDRLIPHPVLHTDISLDMLLSNARGLNSKLHTETIHACGHYIPWEKPEETARLILDFMGK